jgi:YHS domain-containing protein
MGALLDFLLVLVIVRAMWRLLGGVLAGMKSKPPVLGAPEHGVHMVRDPVCGTFVVPDRAISLTVGRTVVYFCSAACRDQYRARPSAHSASSGHPEHVEGRTA